MLQFNPKEHSPQPLKLHKKPQFMPEIIENNGFHVSIISISTGLPVITILKPFHLKTLANAIAIGLLDSLDFYPPSIVRLELKDLGVATWGSVMKTGASS